MKLLLDIGNTRVSWAYAQDGDLLAPGDFIYREQPASLRFSWLDMLAHSPTSVAAVNVAGTKIESETARVIAERFSVDVEFCRTTAKCGGVTNGYTETGQLGVDRWASIVGAWHRYRDDVVVVDAGTAMTVDLVRATGEHLGGLIVPGLALQQSTLGSDTADIAGFIAAGAEVTDAGWFGRNTGSAVGRGALFALIAVIEKSCASFPHPESDAGNMPRLVLTGGDAERLSALLSIAHDLRPHLVIEGLHQLVSEAS